MSKEEFLQLSDLDKVKYAIQASLKEHEKFDSDYWKGSTFMGNSILKTIEQIKNNLVLADVMRWVAVAESIPTEHKLYLTYNGTFRVLRYWKGNNFEVEHVANEEKVTHWIEVPEPPFS